MGTEGPMHTVFSNRSPRGTITSFIRTLEFHSSRRQVIGDYQVTWLLSVTCSISSSSAADQRLPYYNREEDYLRGQTSWIPRFVELRQQQYSKVRTSRHDTCPAHHKKKSLTESDRDNFARLDFAAHLRKRERGILREGTRGTDNRFHTSTFHLEPANYKKKSEYGDALEGEGHREDSYMKKKISGVAKNQW